MPAFTVEPPQPDKTHPTRYWINPSHTDGFNYTQSLEAAIRFGWQHLGVHTT